MRRARINLTYPGWAVLLAVLMLSMVGVLCIHGAPPRIPAHAEARQLLFVGVALAIGIALLKVGYQRLGRLAYALLLISYILLGLLVIARAAGGLPLIREINYTYRWISLPVFKLQPSEITKVTFVIAMAFYLRHKENVRRFSGLLGPFIMTLVPIALVLVQPDLGTALLLMPVLFVMLFAAGARLRHFCIVLLLAGACLPLFWVKMNPYQRNRIAGFILQNEQLRDRIVADPESWSWLCSARTARDWETNDGFQLIGSIGALGNGGLTGRGWKQGAYVRHQFLPARHNDFIFAMIGEQWGFLGCVVVLLGYMVIAVAGFEISSATQDPFGKLLAVGVVALISTQCLVNVGMSIGLMPITGMGLPFVSYGGSSMITSFACSALLISVSQQRPFVLARRPFEEPQASYANVG